MAEVPVGISFPDPKVKKKKKSIMNHTQEKTPYFFGQSKSFATAEFKRKLCKFCLWGETQNFSGIPIFFSAS